MGFTLTSSSSTGTAPADFEDGPQTLRLDMIGDFYPAQCVYDERDEPIATCRKERSAEFHFRVEGGEYDGKAISKRVTVFREFDREDPVTKEVTRVERELVSDRATFGKFLRALLGLPMEGKLPPDYARDSNAWLGKRVRATVGVNERGYFTIEHPKPAKPPPRPAAAERAAQPPSGEEVDPFQADF